MIYPTIEIHVVSFAYALKIYVDLIKLLHYCLSLSAYSVDKKCKSILKVI